MRLFGERGYAATTIASIEEAAGLSGGSGSLYRHFASKQALLEAGIRDQLDGAGSLADDLQHAAAADQPLHARLRHAFEALTARFERSRDLVRMVLRDSRTFPEAMDALRRAQVGTAHLALCRWLAEQPEFVADQRDWPAHSAVILASLAHHWFLTDAFDHDAFDIDHDRFLDALTASTISTLSSTEEATS